MPIIFSTAFLTPILLITLLILQLPLTLNLLLTNTTLILEWKLFSAVSSPISLTLIIDPFGRLFSCTVLFISFNVILFSRAYIKEDPFIKRFTHLVLLFVLSINILIFIPHLVIILLGWDGLGLTSFLLVAYYQNPKSLAAGIITALTNRVGDVLILISIGWLLQQGHWLSFLFWDNQLRKITSIFIIVAGITKRAQIPFSSWLPAAIAAPTPVSALVHSSTLVTAGVFLLFRFYPSLKECPNFSTFLLIIATLTTLIAGLSATTECDIKKIIALSTLSQLGVIIVRLAINMPIFTLFHLLTHALFKALLFICAGSIIHLHHHSQDLRFIGNISHQIPSITSAILIANLALCGSPFLAGFYSKDMILEFSLFSPTNLIIIFLFFLATGLTAAYTVRFLIVTIWAPSSSLPIHNINDEALILTLPSTILATTAVIGGSALNWLILTPQLEIFLPPHLKLLTLLVTVTGAAIFWQNTKILTINDSPLISITNFNAASCTIWFLTPLSSQFIIKSPLQTGALILKTLDQGWEELGGGQGILLLSSKTSSNIQILQKNIITAQLTLIFFLIPIILLTLIFLGSLNYKA